eukprot:1171664-Rhodomonas_salina.2
MSGGFRWRRLIRTCLTGTLIATTWTQHLASRCPFCLWSSPQLSKFRCTITPGVTLATPNLLASFDFDAARVSLDTLFALSRTFSARCAESARGLAPIVGASWFSRSYIDQPQQN